MNLVLDFGNTRIKAGIFNGNELVEKRIFDSDTALMDSTIALLPLKNCMIASVTQAHTASFDFFNKSSRTILFSKDSRLPLKNKYKSALTLGSDRMAASVGSFSFYPRRNVLTIDAGTCIKYNFVNDADEYLGGAISPGIPMRLKAMHHYTSALPLVETDHQYTKLVGETSAESLLSGAQVGAAAEVDGMIERYRSQYENLVVVVTGGDGDYLCSQLKNRFFANQNILLHGLNTILNYNLEK